MAIQKKNKNSSKITKLYSWFKSKIHNIKISIAQTYDKLLIFHERFSVRGIFGFILTCLDMLVNFLVIGLIILLSFALVAFDLVSKHQNTINKMSAIFYDRHGEYIGQRGSNRYSNVSLDEVPDFLIKAVLATEDRRFFQHNGIDYIGTLRALLKNSRAGGVVQGGSTLTQQLAKNIYLSNQRTISRKINEAFIALWLENNLTKKEILERYLNISYMGGGAYGVKAAAKFYFDKDVSSINLAEAAILAGLFKAPSAYAPHINPKAAKERANVVLSNLVNKGFMTESEVAQARLHPAQIKPRLQEKTPGYFLDWAYQQVQRLNEIYQFNTPVVKVTTTFDPHIQEVAEKALISTLEKYGKNYRVQQGASVIIENSGAIRAIVGGVDYEKSQFNRATTAQRQTGSSFKMYVYTTLLEKTNLTPETKVLDAPFNWNGWEPRNYGRHYRGWVTLTDAVVHSYNTVPPRLTAQYLRSTAPIIKTARAMGVTSPLDKNGAMVLGTSGITVLEQATAYNVLANGGVYGNTHGIETVQKQDDTVLWNWRNNHPPFKRAVSEHTAKDMNRILIEVAERGTGTRARLNNVVTAGKSGTSQSYRDAWFAGFTGNYTMVVWLGNDNFTPMNKVTGGFIPAMIWHETMETLHQQIKLKPIFGTNKITRSGAVLNNAKVPNETRNLNNYIVTYDMIPILLKLQTLLVNANP